MNNPPDWAKFGASFPVARIFLAKTGELGETGVTTTPLFSRLRRMFDPPLPGGFFISGWLFSVQKVETKGPRFAPPNLLTCLRYPNLGLNNFFIKKISSFTTYVVMWVCGNL